MSTETMILRGECRACSGTGLHIPVPQTPQDPTAPETPTDLAIICIYCEGSGEKIFEVCLVPFTGRKTLPVPRRITRVKLPEGHDPERREVTYEEFLQGKL